MAEKREFSQGGTIGMISSVDTRSTTLNCQGNLGGVKPKMKGDYNPGKTRPERAPEQKVMMPK